MQRAKGFMFIRERREKRLTSVTEKRGPLGGSLKRSGGTVREEEADKGDGITVELN
jgi:hypothetical protein